MLNNYCQFQEKNTPSFENVDIIKSITEISSICSASYKKYVAIKTDFKIDKAIIHADVNQIEQAILNLCVNACQAIKNSEKKLKDPEINILLKIISEKEAHKISPKLKRKPYYLLEVKDTGPGINPNCIGKIFDPFFTTKPKGQGTGLGLSMTYNTVKNHSGFIKVNSKVNFGTTFTILLPVPEREIKKARETQKTATKPTEHKTNNILIIDDDTVINNITESYLKENDYKVFTAVNGKLGLEEYQKKENNIDIVILDLEMPEMSGDIVFKKIKKINPQAVIIVTSGVITDQRLKKLQTKFKFQLIEKPYSFDALLQAIKQENEN